MKTSDFDYDLPPEYIAQTPVEPRDTSRLLVYDRATDILTHTTFKNLGDFLSPGDILVLNETRVIPLRLFGHKVPTGGKVELLLLNRRNDRTWEALVGGKGLRVSQKVEIDGGPAAEIEAVLGGSRRLIRFEQPIESYLNEIGHIPLPPYIHTSLTEPDRYQTVYARVPGSAAGPTAGFHFTIDLIERLKERGINFTTITLHIGLDTFAPVTEEIPEDHPIHTEWCHITSQAASVINQTRNNGGRVIAVGTTCVRTLESAVPNAEEGEVVAPYIGPTDLFILPGYEFHAVDMMITNFHLPRSTLIMLVSAFAGRERILAIYEEAKRKRYRFYSFGDAMLIV